MGHNVGLNLLEEDIQINVNESFEFEIEIICEEFAAFVECIRKNAEYIREKLNDFDECLERLEWLAEERADWRFAGLLAAQKAEARARDYVLRLASEKAREIRRRRKWRKRIDDRVYLIQ